MSARIYVVEDHPVMRKATVSLLERQPTLSVVGAAETAEDALAFLETDRVDLVLVDTRLPGIDGIEFVRRVTERWPTVKCLMLSGHGGQSYIDRALDAGARGYLTKGTAEEIPTAIERVLEGGIYDGTADD
jgi:DNA-binding NarL/FixJ family response regulator